MTRSIEKLTYTTVVYKIFCYGSSPTIFKCCVENLP